MTTLMVMSLVVDDETWMLTVSSVAKAMDRLPR